MAASTDPVPQTLPAERPDTAMPDDPMNGARTVPIIETSAPSPGDPMEITSPTSSSAPQSATKSPEIEIKVNGSTPSQPAPSANTSPADSNNGSSSSSSSSSSNAVVSSQAPAPAAPAVHQPKIVQTAFIHKLYNMLEDKSISHLISWTANAESFVMQPSHEFSKVLAQYFKHTNISSFVRQLNMYGFHKVSDVFAQGQPESTMWEFRHGAGNFKRGDLNGLREIKRRASRHALVHREYNNQKTQQNQTTSQPEPAQQMQDSNDARVANLENLVHNLSARLQRQEDQVHHMQIRHQAVMETVSRLLHFNYELSRAVMALAPSSDNPIHRDVSALQAEVQRQMDYFRSLEEPHDQLFAGSRPYFANVENAPVSPRQLPQDDPRRGSAAGLPVPPPRQPATANNYYRPSVPSNLSIGTRRPYGSIGGAGTAQSSPSSLRVQPPPPPPPGPHNHHLANVTDFGPNLARRHTSADIRAHGWQPNPNPNPPPFGGPPSSSSGPSSSQWPPSPNRLAPPPTTEDQRIRESFSHYSFQSASSGAPQSHSRPATPPPPHAFTNGGGPPPPPPPPPTLPTVQYPGQQQGPLPPPTVHVDNTFGSWSWNSASSSSRDRLGVKVDSAPPTRRGSMAHILNPAEPGMEDEVDPRDDLERKRKRLQ